MVSSGGDGPLTTAPISNSHRAVPGAPPKLSDAQFATLQLLHYLRLLWSRKFLIVIATLGIGLGYGLYTKYMTVKWYRAQATITPTSPDQGMSMGSGAGDMIDGMGGGIASLLSFGGASDTVTLSERYIAIMNSYVFTIDLVNRYHLERKIAPAQSKNAPTVTKWTIHRQIVSRFSTEYDYKSGNLSLYFLDPSPEDAQRVLGYYLDSLRNKLRGEEINNATSAADSLQEEVRKTSDALLQTQLYELMARQIQRQKLAQVQADFAFKVIEPPVVPDNYFAPQARYNAILAASVTFTLLCIWIIGADFVRRAKAQYAALIRVEPEPAAPGLTTEDTAERFDDPASPHPKFVRNISAKI